MAAENHQHITLSSGPGTNRSSRGVQWPLTPSVGSRITAGDGNSTLSSRSATIGGLREDLHNVFSRGLGPLMERSHTMGLGTWLRHTHRSSPPAAGLGQGGHHRRGANSSRDNNLTLQMSGAASPDVVVSMEAGVEPTPDGVLTANGAEQNLGSGGSDSVVGQYVDATRQSPELRSAIAVIEKYMPFILILLAKLIFDHKIGILVLIGLVITFFHANTVICREVGKQGKRNLRSLLSVIVNLLTCIFFLLFFVFETDKLYHTLVFLPPFTVHPPSIWDLLFLAGITDFVLKLITIICKAIVVALPATFLPFQRKGKYYLFIEQTSQSYRSLVPVRPWLVYLLEAYTGVGKVVGVALCAAYVVAKGTHVIRGFHEWRNALSKLMQTVTYGSVPSHDQVNAVGNLCPICQDNFRQPTLLNCKHIFCEECVTMWFDRERTCPMCRAQIADDPTWRDGATTYFLQIF